MTDITVDKHYDLIIIGSGSGNSTPGPEFDDRSIAIVEKSAFGGTCLNIRCIPTKMYVYAAGVDAVDGRISVDEFGRSTSAEGIWALGDVSSPYMLKHVANAEMRAVRHNLRHPDAMQKMPHEFVPTATFTNPQIATVGMTEEQAKHHDHNLVVRTQSYGDVA